MKDDIIEFYVKNFEYLINPENIDIDFVPPLVRRRMNRFDRIALFVMNKCMSKEIEYIVFSSFHGECERLFKLIEQYSSTKEVSPAIFSGSVHNYPLGLFLSNSGNTIPYTAICSGENSISAGILTSVASKYDNVLFCYADYHDDNIVSFALNISKTPCQQKFIINIQKKLNETDNFTDYINFFSKKSTLLKYGTYKIERLKDD